MPGVITVFPSRPTLFQEKRKWVLWWARSNRLPRDLAELTPGSQVRC